MKAFIALCALLLCHGSNGMERTNASRNPSAQQPSSSKINIKKTTADLLRWTTHTEVHDALTAFGAVEVGGPFVSVEPTADLAFGIRFESAEMAHEATRFIAGSMEEARGDRAVERRPSRRQSDLSASPPASPPATPPDSPVSTARLPNHRPRVSEHHMEKLPTRPTGRSQSRGIISYERSPTAWLALLCRLLRIGFWATRQTTTFLSVVDITSPRAPLSYDACFRLPAFAGSCVHGLPRMSKSRRI